MDDEHGTVGEHLDEKFRRQDEELAMMHEALRVERARSDLLWDIALRRGEITEEEWAIARDPDGLQRLQEAKVIKARDQLPG